MKLFAAFSHARVPLRYVCDTRRNEVAMGTSLDIPITKELADFHSPS